MKSFKYSLVLILVSAIWGFSFVAQRSGMDYVGPYTFNGVRFLLGSLSLLPLYFLQKDRKRLKIEEFKKISLAGLILGVALFIAASLQQIGMQFTSAANGGFITSLYVVLVPIFYLFLKRKVGLHIWFGAILAVVGLYFLSVKEGLSINWGDSLVLISAVFWAIHVMMIGYFAPKYAILLLSIIQFTITAILSLSVAFVMEDVIWTQILSGYIPIIYGGIFAVGIAYTLQVFAQKKVASEQAAIILSFESAFAMLGGWLLLNEQHGWRSLMGAGLMMIGIVISQINWKKS
ncbi:MULTISPECIES: DMT family transporter [unclassified Lentimicrobium]|uniref:DMT family transporter n=1 Tax=unclassified Lentimicrobium TaxID=2677434 RepID=UPI001556C889|nr:MULTISPECIES: DMT family transporter [unclassified Lentimicrobium]NPD46511.1 DMT family transporter [Lentimicrobium sp. S6]NPD85160.1 DMT family transporter [Lentimicrobium sp. L6]